MTDVINTDVCIVGGGPGGSALGYSLALAGANVVVLEGKGHYERGKQFRGESITVGCVNYLTEMGILTEEMKADFCKIYELGLFENGRKMLSIDFRNSGFEEDFGMMDFPQQIMLNAFAEKAQETDGGYNLMMSTNCTDLIEECGQITGVKARNKDLGNFEIKARLVVDASGRFTKLRDKAGLESKKDVPARDVIWFKIPKPDHWKTVTRVKVIGSDNLTLLPTYPDLLRCAFKIDKGRFKDFKNRGMESFYQEVARLEPEIDGLVREHVKSFSDMVLLDIFTVVVPRWTRDGFVLIGDSAHTMGPVLGQGVNLAIQDGVQLAPVIVAALKQCDGVLPESAFAEWESKRKSKASMIARLQNTQEKLLAWNGPLLVGLRQLLNKVRNNSPLLQRKMFKIFYERSA